MANPGEWIDFAELCRRVPRKSASTLRRYVRQRLISYRQLVRGGRLEFNWRTVERELHVLENPGVHAEAVGALINCSTPDGTRVEQQFAEVNAKLDRLIVLVTNRSDFIHAESRAS